MEKLKQFFSKGKPMPALILLLGIILTESGIFGAFSANTFITLTDETIVTYPMLYVGLLVSLIGAITSVVGYRLFRGSFHEHFGT